VKPLLVAGGVLLLGIAVFAVDVARFGGAFRSFESRSGGTCLEVPLGGSSADLRIDRQRGLAYLSVLDRAGLARGEPLTGSVMLLDLNLAEPTARAALAYDPPDFHPQGLSLFEPGNAPARMFAISLRSQGDHVVEIAERDPAGTFFPRETLSDPSFVQPTAIAAVGARQFYLLNESDGAPATSRMRDLMFRRARGTLVYFDGRAAHLIESGLESPWGLAVSPDGARLYVGETLGKRLKIYSRDPATGAVRLEENVALDTSPNQLDVDTDGVVWIAAHPKLFSLYSHLEQPATRSPTQVLRFDPRGARPAAGERDARLSQVYANDGAQLSAGSAAAHWRDEFLVGGLMQHKVLICKPNP